MDHLADVDVIDFLTSLGIRNVNDGGEEIQFSCPFPGHKFGDESPSAYMNRSSTVFFCHGCKAKGNAIHFLALYEGVSPIVAAGWIRDRYGRGFLDPGESFSAEIEQLLIKDELVVETDTEIHYELQPLEGAPLEYMLSRGFKYPAIEHWGIGYDPLSDRIAIPVTDINNTLIGFKARSYNENHKPKYLALGDTKAHRYGFKPYEKSKVVYGIYNAMVRDPDHVIIVEGELNVVAMWQHGFKNAVALSGSQFSSYQRDLITMNFDAATIFVDSDPAGNGLAADLIDSLLPYIKVSIVEEHDGDPASLSADECSKIISTATTVNELWAKEFDEEDRKEL